jgi:hypothetical protein
MLGAQRSLSTRKGSRTGLVLEQFRLARAYFGLAGTATHDGTLLTNRAPRRIRELGRGIHGGSLMRKYVLGAGLLVAVTAPGLATSSSTTTTTTGGAATTTTEEYYVVRDPSTKKCTISTSKPTGTTTTVVGGDGTVYKSRTEAQAAMTKVCTD